MRQKASSDCKRPIVKLPSALQEVPDMRQETNIYLFSPVKSRAFLLGREFPTDEFVT